VPLGAGVAKNYERPCLNENLRTEAVRSPEAASTCPRRRVVRSESARVLRSCDADLVQPTEVTSSAEMQRVALLRHALVLRLGRPDPMSADDTGSAARWNLVGFYRPPSRKRPVTELLANDDSACAARDDCHRSTLRVGSRATSLVGSKPTCSHEAQATRDHDEVRAGHSRGVPRLAYVRPGSTTQGAAARRRLGKADDRYGARP
jgi:hypothetical protein